ncbi:MAG: F0F1 ATP synthase subunit delta [Candidatus Omnitrophica bacterium]|nr:F0F1 ATP synthase subunit delta [Candidatus Omnitrophota bacterium]
MSGELIIQFLVLTAIVSGGIIFALHRVFVSSVEGAKMRLDRDAEAARAREAELNRKIRQADDELAQRKRELDALELKMKGELEADANKRKEELVGKARLEAEEIIIKAQNAAEGIRRDIEKQMELKIVDYSVKIIDEILTKKAKAALERDLIDDFIAQLREVDMSRISTEIRQADIVTVNGATDADVKQISDIIRTKTGREMTLTAKAEAGHISGVVLKFGSLQLDASLKTAIRDNAVALKTLVEKSYQDKK